MRSFGSAEQLTTGIAGMMRRTRRDFAARDREQLSLLVNSVALILARVSSSGLGFITWLIAARLYAANEVGIASGVVSAMMLCVQLALLGAGSAIIKLYPRHASRPEPILNTAFNLVFLASLLGGLLFLLLASALFRELNVVSQSTAYSLLFLGITVFGSINVLFDHVSIALQRGVQVLTRNVLFGVVAIGAVGAVPLLTDAADSTTIVFAWVLAGLSACALGAIQLRQAVTGYRYRPQVNRSITQDLLRVGIPNYLLTLTERAPAWILPILVTELLSPTDNAHWYTVWMMAWVVLIVPISVGQNLFAAISREPESLRVVVPQSIRTSLAVGGLGSAAVIVFAPLILALLGKDYAEAGTLPLRILSLSLIPATFIQGYYAMCRGFHRLHEATQFGAANGFISVVGTAWAGVNFGLLGMAVAWLMVQSVTALWAGYRIRRFAQRPAPVAGEGEESSSAEPLHQHIRRPVALDRDR